jgi:hypothetical protein
LHLIKGDEMNTGKKFLTRVGGIAAIAVAGLVLSAVPAQADWTNCRTGYACLWTHDNYKTGNKEGPVGSFSNSLNVTKLINSIANAGRYSTAYFYDAGMRNSIHLHNPSSNAGQSRDPYLSNGTDHTTVDWSGNKIKYAKFA